MSLPGRPQRNARNTTLTDGDLPAVRGGRVLFASPCHTRSLTTRSEFHGRRSPPQPKQTCRTEPERLGGRLWRHRHQPAVCPARMLRGSRAGSAQQRKRARRVVADLLVVDPGHHRKVPGLRHARRQPRRGRHPGAVGAGESAPGGNDNRPPGADRARPVWRGAALRGRHDHAGHLRVECGRGLEGGDADAGALCRAADRRHPRRPVLVPEVRHGARGPGVRPGDAAVVRHAGGAGRVGDRAPPRGARGHQSGLCDALLFRDRLVRIRGVGRGRAGGDRRRSALRRHGTFRQASRFARRGSPWCFPRCC